MGSEAVFNTRSSTESYQQSGEVLQHFQPQDIFNADESALFYNMPPNKTIGSAPTPGLKKNKTTITILLACNSTGSERLEPLFIGKHKQPRAFNKQTPEDLGIQYFFNNTAWIIAAFKKHYRATQYGQALLEAELGSTDIYKMDILMAMRLCQQIWREFSGSAA